MIGISSFAAQSVVATDTDTLIRRQAPYVTSGKITNLIPLEESVFYDYSPQNLTVGSFNEFSNQKNIQIGDRAYEFYGGAVVYANQRKMTNNPKDILPTKSLDRPLPLEEAFVDIHNNFLLLTYKYDDAFIFNRGYSYALTVKTPLDHYDLEQAQIETLLHKYSVAEASRDAFKHLKSGGLCSIDGKNYFFLNGSIIYKDYEVSKSTPEDVLPSDLWLNGWRANHQLVHIDVEPKSGVAKMTYKYEPSVYYQGTATHFSFTVGTPLSDLDALFVKRALVDRNKLAKKVVRDADTLYTSITNANKSGLLSDEASGEFMMRTATLRRGFLNILWSSQLSFEKFDQASQDKIENEFSSVKNDLASASIKLVHTEPSQEEKLVIIDDMMEDLLSDISEAKEQGILSEEIASELSAGVIYAANSCREDVEQLSQKMIHKTFDFLESKLDMATSPMSLMFNGVAGYENINLFTLAKNHKNLSVVTDSIKTFNTASQH